MRNHEPARKVAMNGMWEILGSMASSGPAVNLKLWNRMTCDFSRKKVVFEDSSVSEEDLYSRAAIGAD